MNNQRKYFGTDGIRGYTGTYPITPDFALKLGWAAGCVLAKKPGTGRKVLIGKDTRISGYMFESALEAGLSAAGMDSYLLGPMPTPAIAYLTRTLRAEAGIVISASHNLYYDNGIKFFDASGRKLPDEVELEIEKQLEKPLTTVASEALGKASRVVDATGRYIEFCKSTIPSEISLKGLKIIVDCANGATYNIAPAVFSELDAEVVELFVDPDGLNINDRCGATQPETLRQIVLAEEADLGIALDGDGDRLIMIDHTGAVVDGDDFLYILSTYWRKAGKPLGGVVGTLMSNYGLELFFNREGIEFVRAKVGDRYVMSELQSRHWILGGETSGHVICLNKTSTGDGIVTALQVLQVMIETGKTLHELRQGFQKLPQKLVNVKTSNIKDIAKDEKVQQAVSMAKQKLQNQGRVLLRASGTEPVVRVMVEGMDDQLISQIAEDLADIVRQSK